VPWARSKGLGVRRSIILLVGPSWRGYKTSIGHSIAERPAGRLFTDSGVVACVMQAEIRGAYRRTYIGPHGPGKFRSGIKDVGVMNPSSCWMEIDKLGSSPPGDPASALLEPWTRARNKPCSATLTWICVWICPKSCLLCTANTPGTVFLALWLDRMGTFHPPVGYISEEKLASAKTTTCAPRQTGASGVAQKAIAHYRQALRNVIEGYAREAGRAQTWESSWPKIVP